MGMKASQVILPNAVLLCYACCMRKDKVFPEVPSVVLIYWLIELMCQVFLYEICDLHIIFKPIYPLF